MISQELITNDKVDKHVIDSIGPDMEAVCSSLYSYLPPHNVPFSSSLSNRSLVLILMVVF